VIGLAHLRLFGHNSRCRIGRFNFAHRKCHTLVYAREWIITRKRKVILQK
jgi:hypothetical protein